MFRQQGLAQARAITGQTLQDDDSIQEYNHMEHLNYLKNLSIATDKITKKDKGDEDTSLEESGGSAVLSAYGVYGARNTQLDMQNKVGKYLDDLKSKGKSAEDLRDAFAEQGGVGSTIKKAFVNTLASAREATDKIGKNMTSTYKNATEVGQDIGEEVQSIGADGVATASDTLQSATQSAQATLSDTLQSATQSAEATVSDTLQSVKPPSNEGTELNDLSGRLNLNYNRTDPSTTAGPLPSTEIDRGEEDFNRTTAEAQPGGRSQFASEPQNFENTGRSEYTNKNSVFFERGPDEAYKYMDGESGIKDLEGNIANHNAKTGTDDFNFQRKFDPDTRIVRDQMWPSNEPPPALLPGEKVVHAGSVKNGTITMTEGSTKGASGSVGEGIPQVDNRPKMPPRKNIGSVTAELEPEPQEDFEPEPQEQAPEEPQEQAPEQAPEEVALPASEHSSGTSAEDLRNGLKDAFKSDADKAAEKTGAVFGKVGQVAGKVAAKFGDALGVGANIAGAGYATEQEAKDVFGKHSHLEGDGNWEKAGNLVSMVGDDTALLGSLARFGGPEGAIIGTGAELVGGAIGLVGSGLDAIGEYFQGEKKTATASAVAKKAMPESAPVQTVAIQNTQGSGGIANVSQSALKQLN